MRRTIQRFGVAAALAAVVGVPALARGATCGNGVLEPGEECDAGAAACTYVAATPEASIDCRNALCTAKATGTDFVCTDQCVLTPACRPLLDDPARIVFRADPKLDMVKVVARAVPLTDMDPVADTVIFSSSNINGPIYSEVITPGKFIPNTKFTAWKYVLKRTGSPMIYVFRINKRLNKLTGNTEFILKVTAEGDLSSADPLFTGQTVEDLQTMTIQIAVGDDVFYNTSTWERKSNGWYLADKYMFM